MGSTEYVAKWLLLFALVGLSALAFGQRTKVSGTITDQASGERLPFANVVFKGTNIGGISDDAGKFNVEANGLFDTLQVSMVGYETAVIPIRAGASQKVNIELSASSIKLNEFTVKPGENPAFRILRKAIGNKPKNTSANVEAYEYDVYHRVQFDLNNFTDKAKNNIFLKPFDYIWENTDTTEDGVKYLPMLLTETDEKHFYRKDPAGRKEIIKGKRTFRFFDAPRVTKFSDELSIDPDVYRNFVVILDRSFPSPLNDHYKAHYKFLLVDSLVNIDGHSCYKITFRPKGKAAVAFVGEMFIEDQSFAITQVDLEFSIDANVNFVRNYWIRQNFTKIDNEQWFLTKSQVIADFTVVESSEEMTGFFGRKTTKIRNVILNKPREDKHYAKIDPLIVEPEAYDRSEEYWEEVRGDTFSIEEQKLIDMVGRMNSDPSWKRMMKGIRVITHGWLPVGNFEFGTIFTIYSYNRIEGSRFKLALRTSDKFHRRWRLAGHAAYGLNDQKWKGSASVDHLVFGANNKKMVFGASFRNDLFQQGRSENVVPLDHIFTTQLLISGKFQPTFAEQAQAYVERQWFTGFSTRVSVFRDRFNSYGEGFGVLQEGETAFVPSFTGAGIKFNFRFALGAADLPATFRQVDRGIFSEKFPIISLELAKGLRGFLDGQFDYEVYKLKVDYRWLVNKWGFLNILAEGGVIDGTLPYPLLYVPYGNPTLFNDDHSFNLMNYMEFVSDRYVSIQLEHHLDGLLLNKIPGLRKLKFRSLIVGKVFYGTLSEANNGSTFQFARNMRDVGYPYTEIGFGIENILKISRIDFTWRMSHLDNPEAFVFLVKPSFYFRF